MDKRLIYVKLKTLKYLENHLKIFLTAWQRFYDEDTKKHLEQNQKLTIDTELN